MGHAEFEHCKKKKESSFMRQNTFKSDSEKQNFVLGVYFSTVEIAQHSFQCPCNFSELRDRELSPTHL